MPTLNVGASAQLNISAGQSVNFVSSFGTNFRYAFAPYNPEASPAQNSSRSYGPAAQNVTPGPFAVSGLMTIWNDSGSTLTYNSVYPSAFEAGIVSVYSTATFTAAVAMNPANANVTISPTGTGLVTINPATTGAIDNCTVGATTPRAVRTAQLQMTFTDSSGTPGNVTNNAPRGRVAIAAASASITVTNSLATVNSTILAFITQAAADATLTQIVRVAPAAGSFTITGNAAATANTVVDFVLIN